MLAENNAPKAHSWMLSEQEEMEYVEGKYGPHALPTQIVHFLHSVPTQIASIGLLALDIIIILVELKLDMQFPPCYIILRDATSCCNITHEPAPPHHHDLHAITEHGHANLCPAGLTAMPDYQAGCDYHAHPQIHTVHDVLFFLSVFIACCFAVELALLFLIEGAMFLRNPLYVFDAMVVSSALFLELYMNSIGNDDLAAFAGALVFTRLWRFVRVGHALYMVKKKKGSVATDKIHSCAQAPSHRQTSEVQLQEAPSKWTARDADGYEGDASATCRVATLEARVRLLEADKREMAQELDALRAKVGHA